MSKVIMLCMKSWRVKWFGVGRYIIEDEQNGQSCAAYGQGVLKELSKKTKQGDVMASTR